MKNKFLLILLSAAICLSLALPAFANDAFAQCVGLVNVPFGVPSVDGVIGETEGWSDAVSIDKTLYGTAWSSESDFKFSFDFYTAYDEKGIYIAADIKDNFTLRRGSDLSQIENGTVISSENYIYDENGMAFDGDDFIFMLDPHNYFARNGFDDRYDYTAWYNVGLTESGAKLIRTRFNDGEVAGAAVAGAKTDDGWLFEAFIPYSEIIKDAAAASDGAFNITEAQLAEATKGNMFEDGFADKRSDATFTSAEIIYADRYKTADGNTETWQRYCTVASSVRGINGESSDSVSAACYGIFLRMLEKGSTEDTGRIAGFGGNQFDGTSSVDAEHAAMLGKTDKNTDDEDKKEETTTETVETTGSIAEETSKVSHDQKEDKPSRLPALVPLACILLVGVVAAVIVKKKSAPDEDKKEKND